MVGPWVVVLAAVAVVAAACASPPAGVALRTEEAAIPQSLPPTAAPQSGTWEALDFAAAAGAEAVWTGGDVLVFHHADPSPKDASVVRLDPDSGAVTETSPDRTSLISSIASQWTWTGRELVVWVLAQIDAQTTADGSTTSYAAQGVAYDPDSGTWRQFASASVDSGTRRPQVGVAGASLDGEVLVWSHGVAFDPVSGASRFVAVAPLAPRVRPTVARTTEHLLVWSGDGMTDGAAYDPATDTWTTLTRPPLPAADRRVAAWTGTEVLVWDGSASAAYDPALDTWRTLPEAPVHGTVAVWSGTELLLAAGAAYDPATDSWRTLPPPPLPVAEQVTAVWTGDAMVVVGTTGSAVYRPSAEAATDAVPSTARQGAGPRAGDIPSPWTWRISAPAPNPTSLGVQATAYPHSVAAHQTRRTMSWMPGAMPFANSTALRRSAFLRSLARHGRATTNARLKSSINGLGCSCWNCPSPRRAQTPRLVTTP